MSQVTKVEYMKTTANIDDYLTIEKEWRTIHERRLQQGLIYGWYLIKKHFTGTEDEYDYISVTIYPSFETMQAETPDNVFAGFDDDFFVKTESSRDLIRSEIYDTPIVTEVFKLPQYVLLTFMKVDQGNDDEYLKIEREIWKPVNEFKIKKGIQSTYSVYRQLYPGGYANAYNYATIRGFADLLKVSQKPPQGWEELLISVHPDQDPSRILNNTFALRKQVKLELWEILESVVPQ